MTQPILINEVICSKGCKSVYEFALAPLLRCPACGGEYQITDHKPAAEKASVTVYVDQHTGVPMLQHLK